MPFFSVIIPLYNKEKYILNCLESALNQTFSNYEIVIINDGSTDSSIAIVETFKSDKIKLFHQENLGVSYARNNGAMFGEGTYLAFLDADDIWKPNHLEVLKESIDKFPNASLYANNYKILYNQKYTVPARLNIDLSSKQPILLDNFFKASLKDTVVWTSAAAIKKEIFIAVGKFNTTYKTTEDIDLWIRIALKQDVVFNPKYTMIYLMFTDNSLRKYEDNLSRYILFNSFKDDEIKNPHLKEYLDIKRYGLALRTKVNGENQIYKDTVKEINLKNLSLKKQVLLKVPVFLLKSLNIIKPFFVNSKLYLKLFKC